MGADGGAVAGAIRNQAGWPRSLGGGLEVLAQLEQRMGTCGSGSSRSGRASSSRSALMWSVVCWRCGAGAAHCTALLFCGGLLAGAAHRYVPVGAPGAVRAGMCGSGPAVGAEEERGEHRPAVFVAVELGGELRWGPCVDR